MRALFVPACFVIACSGSTGGTGGSGGGSANGGGAQGGQAITADAGDWTFVRFPDSACGNGSPAGIGVNLGSPSKLFVYFEGGGACWDSTTCYTLQSAAQVNADYTDDLFARDVSVLEGTGLFARDGSTPFSDATWVYVPYCTGDLHAGTTVQMFDGGTMHFEGGHNVDAFLKRLTATLPAATQVWVSGSSAGGYGATFNMNRFAAAFPGAELDLLQDSSPFISTTTWPIVSAVWQPVLPCTACTNLPDILTAYETAHPSSRIGLLSYLQDTTIPTFFSLTTTAFTQELNTLTAASYTGPPHCHFDKSGAGHVLLGSYLTLQGTSVSLKTFVDGWATGNAAWASDHP